MTEFDILRGLGAAACRGAQRTALQMAAQTRRLAVVLSRPAGQWCDVSTLVSWTKRLPPGRAAALGTGEGAAYCDPHARVESISERTCSATFTIATHSQDREGDVVLPSGIRLDHYRNSALWLFEHGKVPYWPLPIGKAKDPQTGRLCVDITPQRATATCFFQTSIRQIDEIWQLVAAEVLNTASISFLPVRMEHLRPGKSHGRPGVTPRYLISECELLEISVAIIAANPECLRSELGRKSFSPELKRALEEGLPARPARAVSGWNKSATGMAAGTGANGGFVAQPTSTPRGPKRKVRGDVQAVVVPKQRYAGATEAARVVRQLGYDISDCRESVEAWVFNQYPPEELVEGTDRVESTDGGCRLIVGKRGPARGTPDHDAGETPPAGPLSRSLRKTRRQADEIDLDLDLDAIMKSLAEASDHLNQLAGAR